MREQMKKWAARLGAVLLALGLGISSTQANVVVAPNNLAAADATFGSGILVAANYREQQVYGASHFSGLPGLWITEIRYRPDRTHGAAFSTTIANIQINMSTTTRGAESLSSTFANNTGPNDTVVFSGPLSISSTFTGPPAGPKNFDIIIPLQTPFLYDPAAGNLLVDVRNFSGGAATGLSGQAVAGDAASRVGGSLSSSSGGVDTGVEALQMIYSLTNPPPQPPQPTLLTRGPYLQNGTVSNLMVRWRTSRVTNSVVQFGLAPAALAWAVTNTVPTNEHAVTLTNLLSDTKYFYALGTSETNFAGGSNYLFITPPATPRPTRIWITGDAGTANYGDSPGVDRNPFGMRDAYYNYTTNRYTDLWLMLGDNAYGVGADEEYSTNVFGTFPTMLRQTLVWSTIGNHDAVNADTYLNIFSHPKNGEAGGVASGSELYYSFNYGNIHFVCLDSEISANQAGSPMLTWLEQDLQDHTNDWLIAYWHSPPYNYGSHNSDSAADSGGHLVQMRENVVPLLENYGLDLVFNGHSHAYERSFLLDGHYGYAASITSSMRKDSGSGREEDSGAYLKQHLTPTEHEGAVYVVCGSSGWVTPPVVSPNLYLKHPAHFIGLPVVGSMVLDVSSNRLDAKFLSAAGTVDDHFTLRKGVGPEPLKIATAQFTGGSVTFQFKTIAGQSYRVEETTQLGPSNWQPVSGTMTASGATTRWTGTVAGGGNHFYRVSSVP